jgi:hypothetical protein
LELFSICLYFSGFLSHRHDCKFHLYTILPKLIHPTWTSPIAPNLIYSVSLVSKTNQSQFF